MSKPFLAHVPIHVVVVRSMIELFSSAVPVAESLRKHHVISLADQGSDLNRDLGGTIKLSTHYCLLVHSHVLPPLVYEAEYTLF